MNFKTTYRTLQRTATLALAAYAFSAGMANSQEYAQASPSHYLASSGAIPSVAPAIKAPTSETLDYITSAILNRSITNTPHKYAQRTLDAINEEQADPRIGGNMDATFSFNEGIVTLPLGIIEDNTKVDKERRKAEKRGNLGKATRLKEEGENKRGRWHDWVGEGYAVLEERSDSLDGTLSFRLDYMSTATSGFFFDSDDLIRVQIKTKLPVCTVPWAGHLTFEHETTTTFGKPYTKIGFRVDLPEEGISFYKWKRAQEEKEQRKRRNRD